MLIRSTLTQGEDYASVADLLSVEDLPQETLRIWGKPIRVRGLSLMEREDLRAQCWREDGQRDTVALVKGYLRYGIVVPQMNDAQLDQFVRKHAGSIEQIYQFIDRLTELDYDLVIAQARYLAGLAPGKEQDAAGGDAQPNNRQVDRSTGKARRPRSVGAVAAD